MSNFTKAWNQAILQAQQTGQPVVLYKQDHMLGQPYPVARTMHPSFMGVRPAKYDPSRDQNPEAA